MREIICVFVGQNRGFCLKKNGIPIYNTRSYSGYPEKWMRVRFGKGTLILEEIDQDLEWENTENWKKLASFNYGHFEVEELQAEEDGWICAITTLLDVWLYE